MSDEEQRVLVRRARDAIANTEKFERAKAATWRALDTELDEHAERLIAQGAHAATARESSAAAAKVETIVELASNASTIYIYNINR